MQTIVECVPNFSEGRDPQRVEAIIEALLAGPDVYLLDKEMDRDHNRSVITLVGTRESVGEAALRGTGKAAELIDLNQRQGAQEDLSAENCRGPQKKRQSCIEPASLFHLLDSALVLITHPNSSIRQRLCIRQTGSGW